jgi:hypothetical protein
MKSALKPPGIKRLKRKCDEPPSNFGFKSDLRRYTKVKALLPQYPTVHFAVSKTKKGYSGVVVMVGRCRLTLSSPR